MYCVYFPQLFRVVDPLLPARDTDEYACVHNTVLAHMEAYDVFKTEIYPIHKGKWWLQDCETLLLNTLHLLQPFVSSQDL